MEQDTDRDRYMSPIETKQYGLIDHVIGGDDAGFKFTVCNPSPLLFQPACTAPALCIAAQNCEWSSSVSGCIICTFCCNSSCQRIRAHISSLDGGGGGGQLYGAKRRPLILHCLLDVQGSTTDFPKTKEQYVNWCAFAVVKAPVPIWYAQACPPSSIGSNIGCSGVISRIVQRCRLETLSEDCDNGIRRMLVLTRPAMLYLREPSHLFVCERG